MLNETVLRELENLLYGLNYAVSLHDYELPFVKDFRTSNYINQALPKAVVGGTQSITGAELLDEVEDFLKYAGDAGAGPEPTVLSSLRFREALLTLRNDLSKMTSIATSITSFWLKSGHPAYPVWWDFAFVIEGPERVEIFIGSSSD